MVACPIGEAETAQPADSGCDDGRNQESACVQLIEQAIELDGWRAVVRGRDGQRNSELLIDCGEPVPGLLAVFERSEHHRRLF